MRTYDVVMLVLLGIWWLFYRKKYDRNSVVLYYIGGVFFADILSALLILMYKQNPAILSAPAWLMPIGGVAGLLCGATTGRIAKGNPPAQ